MVNGALRGVESSRPGLAHFYPGSALVRKQLRLGVGEGGQASLYQELNIWVQDFGGSWRGLGERVPHLLFSRVPQRPEPVGEGWPRAPGCPPWTG